VDFGGGPITGDYDIYLVKLDSNGNHLWSRYFPGNDLDHGFGVAADGSANIILTGDFYGTVNLGGGPLTSPGNNNYDIFLAKFDPNGVHVWSKRFGNTGSFDDSGNSVAACASGNIVVTGSCVGPVDFGGGPLTGNGFIARFDASGAHLSSLIFGTSGNASGSSVAAGDCEDFVVTGSFGIVPGGTVDFGGGPLTSAGNNDIFIAKFKEQPLPVLITSFEAMSREGSVEITWDIWSDEAIESYRLYRRDDARLHALVIAQGPLDATTRSYVDASVEPGTTYHYELLVHTQDGDDIRSPVATVTVPALKATLGQNFPNPFKPATVIEFTLGEQSSAVLGIYDVAGRLVARLDQGVRDAGTYRAGWDGRDAGGRAVSSGVYFYRLEGAPGVPSKKMVLIK
jgi:hypothetical protein